MTCRPRAGQHHPIAAVSPALPTPQEQFSMVDQESKGYRARRAWVDPDAPAEPAAETPSAPPSSPPPAATPPPAPASAPPPVLPEPFDDEDVPKPLYRDEVASAGPTVSGPTTPSQPPAAPPPAAPPPVSAWADRSDDTATRSINFAPRRPRGLEDEATTILPRTGSSVRRPVRRDLLDDFDDDEDERRPMGQRTRLALLIGAVAAIIVIGLGVFYAVGGFTGTPTGQSTPSASLPGTPAASSAAPTVSAGGGAGGAILTAASMLTPAQAKTLDAKRTWSVEKTQTDPAGDVSPACLGGDPVEGQPLPQQLFTQVLKSSGKQAPSALHQASAYSSPEEATQAFAVAAKTLGGCPALGSYIVSGRTISGLGDQAAGVKINSVDGSTTTVHSVVLARTGRVLDVLDVGQSANSVSMDEVTSALNGPVRVQCPTAGGKCGGTPKVKNGPPPLGGDEPGFLAAGDLPPAKAKVSTWNGTAIELPRTDFQGSNCEVVNWTTLDAESKSSRIYIYSDAGDSQLGVNEIVLTMKDDATATKLATKIKDNVAGCTKRTLTPTVSGPTKVASVGARSTEVVGWTAVVTQKTGKGSERFRVGIVAAGSKVVYTFLNATGDYDVTDTQWDTVALRAGERATQVN